MKLVLGVIISGCLLAIVSCSNMSEEVSTEPVWEEMPVFGDHLPMHVLRKGESRIYVYHHNKEMDENVHYFFIKDTLVLIIGEEIGDRFITGNGCSFYSFEKVNVLTDDIDKDGIIDWVELSLSNNLSKGVILGRYKDGKFDILDTEKVSGHETLEYLRKNNSGAAD